MGGPPVGVGTGVMGVPSRHRNVIVIVCAGRSTRMPPRYPVDGVTKRNSDANDPGAMAADERDTVTPVPGFMYIR